MRSQEKTQEKSTVGRFSIMIDGMQVASFSELQGITTKAGQTTSSRKLLGHELTHTLQQAARSGPVTMNVRASDIGAIAAQRLRMAVGRTLTLRMADDAGRPTGSYRGTLERADKQATSERVTIVCDHLQRVGV